MTVNALLETVEGEIAFFRSVMRARPVGIHRHFHVLAIRSAILKDTGQIVSTDDIWTKLRSCYDLDALEGLETDGYDSPSSSTPLSISSPPPSQNLSTHPFFREEFSLPFDETFEALVSSRRMRATASLPSSSPAPSLAPPAKPRGRVAKRGRSKLDMAGLVGGDSDSSALTQESGDEGVAPTPRSAVTGTDGGTDYADDEDVEMRENSPAPSASSKPARNKLPKSIKRGAAVAGRTRAAAGTSTRGWKKKKK